MSLRRLVSLAVPALIITLAIAVSAQAPPATTSDSAREANVLTNQFIIEMAAPGCRKKLSSRKPKPRRRSSTCQLPRWLNGTPVGVRQCGRGSHICDEGENMKRRLGKIAAAFLVLVLATAATMRAQTLTVL